MVDSFELRSRFLYNAPPHSNLWNQLHEPSASMPFFTASSVANIFGFGFQSRKAYFESFRKPKIAANKFLQTMLDYGNANEENAWRQFLADSNYELYQNQLGIYSAGPESPWLLATPDAIGFNGIAWHLVELKCPYSRKIPQDVDEVPLKYVLQLQIQMHCFRFPDMNSVAWGKLYFWSETEDSCFTVTYNKDLMEMVIKELRLFREDVIAGTLTDVSPAKSHRLTVAATKIEKKLKCSIEKGN